ncbi:IS3-family mobile element-associated protein [Octadecabacter antarcticus 307]|uniref:IS3-family mobile element-associated protein n=2 Tax=Rhodobacterales TaxID=204455 RepID=M9RFL2_9RHOB|nr:IS3-family mobile element-associated protein [Octadecabacter antarcticus 307]AGI69439.1 IS3-family mobile element-associated protein [Octadecabacter antarcticus 307]
MGKTALPSCVVHCPAVHVYMHERGEGISQGISQGIYYKWSKDFMEAGKKRLAGDTARAATTDEVKDLRREARDLKEVVAEQTLELRLLKKSMFDGGGDHE